MKGKNKRQHKRIATITLSCALNYGATLQTVALYHYLESEGYNPVIIDYVTERYWYDNKEYSELVYRRLKSGINKSIRKLLWELRVLPKLKEKRDIFRSFLDDNVEFTQKYHYEQDFLDNPIIADAFISGSDQIWNPQYIWSGIIDRPFYLSFVPDDIPKISYGSSFGKVELAEDEAIEIKQCLSRYNALSVREESGRAILNRMGFNGKVVLDPTLIVERDYWTLLADKSSIKDEEDYVLYFTIGNDKNLKRMTMNYCKDKKLKLKVISLERDGLIRRAKTLVACSNCQNTVLPSVYDWLASFRKASYIITNSFHGTAFAINFRVPFTSSVRVANSERITNLLDMCGLSKRSMDDYSIDNLRAQISDEIDWLVIDCNLSNCRKESRDWICKELSKII